MQDKLMQDAIRPFSTLTQENMAAFAAFATSPEVVAQSATTVTQWFQRSAEAASTMTGSGAYARLLETLTQNYTQFLTDASQGAMHAVSESQAALVRQAQDATETVTQAAKTNRRSR